MTELFADLVGQPQAVSLLTAALERRRLAPAYLFVGPDGVGRRLAALRLLEGVLAGGTAGSVPLRRRLAEGNHPDLLWVEPTYLHQGRLVKASEAEAQGLSRRSPPQLRLEQVREVPRFLARRPVEGERSLVVLETVEAMAEAAANALLKTLEEPGHGLLILLTATPDRLLSTIRSRCQAIPFARLPPALVHQVLAGLPAPEGAQEGTPERTVADPPELLELAAGSPGALLRHRRVWQGLPEGLAERLLGLGLGREPMEALGLARDLSEALDGEQQLWLLDWWQLHLWRRRQEPAPLRRIEQLRSHLLAYVQPRLAWEVALLDLGG
ncbi:MAG: DNA polymerase III subunit delta' [Cyanobacteria bacterium K_Offshore_surface_m2_011]|nr:DNA polymerase III subunit delta' [Cyanobacteria bacterium K_Offshore_surface_m2_011]